MTPALSQLSLVVPFLLGFLGAGILAWLFIRKLAPLGWIDHPGHRKAHDAPTARTGGLALGIACLAMAMLQMGALPLDAMELAGCLGLGALGFVDDLRELSARPKAILGLSFAALLAWHAAMSLKGGQSEVLVFGLSLETHLWITFPLLLLWFWAMPQAFNLSDGLNGLALGLFGVAMLVVGGVTFLRSPGFWGAWAAILLLNFPRARHFLGDCGSLGMGTVMAILMMRWAVQVDAGLALWVGSYWVADVTSVVLIRALKGRPLGQGDLNHIHHRMLELTGRRVLWATPLLVLMGGLPMLRSLPGPLAQFASLMGLFILVAFSLTHIAQAVQEPLLLPADPPIRDTNSGAFQVESLRQ